MRLYYYRDSRGNFGDDLNVWLWPQLLGKLVDTLNPYFAFNKASITDVTETIFLGVGTLLNQHVPVQPRKVVLGAGVGYGDVPQIDEKWSIYAVRGPRSAHALGIDQRFAITDSGVLVRAVELPEKEKTYPISFFSYHENAQFVSWKTPCQLAGIHHIDPSADVLQVLDQIMCTEVLLTEAMHGAIVADALRVPWIPVKVFHRLNRFKWMDWCESLKLHYQPYELPSIEPRKYRGVKGYARKLLQSLTVCQKLRRLGATVEPVLSEDRVILDATERLLEQIENMKRDIRA